MINKLPLKYRKANKARCDKKRNRARKETKMLYKKQMGCCYNKCKEKNNHKLNWRTQYDCIKHFPKQYTQKELLSLSDEKFELYFKKYGECVCKRHLREERILDYIEERKAA